MQCFVLEKVNIILPQPKLLDELNKLYIISLYFTDCIYKTQYDYVLLKIYCKKI